MVEMKRRQTNTIALGAGILLAVIAAGCMTAVTNTAMQAAKASVPAGYEKVWGDEFDGASLDARNWTLRRDMGPTADLSLAGEERPDVVSVADGQLRLNAVRNGGKPPYTTCLSVTTCDKMHFQYGYLEMRAKGRGRPSG